MTSKVRSQLIAVVFLSIAMTLPLSATDQGATPWLIDDVVSAESAGSWVISPDAGHAAWVRHTVEKVAGEEKRVSRLWLTALADGQSRQLTRGHQNVSQPRFSPDGKHLAFLFDRKLPDKETGKHGKSQVWAIPVGGGEAFPVTRLDRGVRAFAWIDSKTLVVAAKESALLWELSHKESKDTAIVVADEEHEPPVRLFKVGMEDGTAQRLTMNDDWIDDLVVSPDGRWAVVRAQQSLWYDFDHKVPPHTFMVSMASGEMRQVLADEKLVPAAAQWQQDSSGFYFIHEHSRHPVYRMATINQLWFHDLESGRTEQVDLPTDRGISSTWRPGYAVTDDGVIALLADGVRYRPVRLTRDRKGWQSQPMTGTHQHNIHTWKLAQDGKTFLYEYSAATVPPQWYCAQLVGNEIREERKLTELNQRFDGKPTGRVEVLSWPGANDEEVEGILHYPLEWREGRRSPLLLLIHGGPTGTDRDSWGMSWTRPVMLWRQRGAFILQVNYHGSAGYGLDWAESIEGKYYELEIPDIEKGVDLLIERGLVDAERLGSVGWSNGGILTAELITRTQRYKAASVGAADVEWFSDWGNVDFGAAFDNYYFGGTPWEVPQVYLEKSPFFRLTEVTTPTIIFTGTEDTNVPPHQSWSLFRALRQIGQTEARLVIFPGEPHGLRKLAHQRRKLEEELAWLDRYLFAAEPVAHPAVKPGSLLAGLLQRTGAARVGAALGLQVDGGLIPETITYKGLEIGRFEVTRAQMAAFNSDYQVAPGAENMPATGITFAQAQSYVDWLSRVTGKQYRLPTTEEADKIAGSAGNTLDRWAGYSPNPEDAAGIAAELAPIGDAPLLLPVGSLAGAGDKELVFDLDGNAAEWAVDKDGKGVPAGPSADRAEDKRSNAKPAPAYTGLRVVVDS
jgi:dipeptidyl aminopeptidase/acylaminoacyl peptidase